MPARKKPPVDGESASGADGSASTNGSAPNGIGFSRLNSGDRSRLGANTTVPFVASHVPPPQRRRKPVERELNLSELIKVMYRGRWIILASFIIVFAYTVYSTYS